jgi:hypothetical protein
MIGDRRRRSAPVEAARISAEAAIKAAELQATALREATASGAAIQAEALREATLANAYLMSGATRRASVTAARGSVLGAVLAVCVAAFFSCTASAPSALSNVPSPPAATTSEKAATPKPAAQRSGSDLIAVMIHREKQLAAVESWAYKVLVDCTGYTADRAEACRNRRLMALHRLQIARNQAMSVTLNRAVANAF